MSKKKLMYSNLFLFIAYLPIFFLCVGFKGTVPVIIGLIGIFIYIIGMMYSVSISNDINDDFFLSYKELQEEKKEVDEKWKEVEKIVKDLGTYEGVKYIREKRRKQKIKKYPKYQM